MKKVLIMNDLLNGGGAERVMKNIIQYLLENNYEVTLLILDTSISINNLNTEIIRLKKAKYIDSNLKIARAYNKILNFTFDILNKRLINKRKFDIAIAMKEGHCMQYISELNIPKKLAWVHIDYNTLYWTKNIFGSSDNEKKCMEKFDKIICVSNAVKKSITEKIGDIKNICVRYNPINEYEIIKMSNEKLNIDNSKEDKIIFVTIGRLVNEKGYDRLLNSCIELNKTNKNFEVWIIGNGKEKDRLYEKCKNNKLSNVKFLGYQSNPYKYIKNADWYICTSLFESFSLTIQESITIGTPVITTRCDGACELFDEKKHGFIVDNTEIAIYKGMYKILNDGVTNDFYKKSIKSNEILSMFDKRCEDICELF